VRGNECVYLKTTSFKHIFRLYRINAKKGFMDNNILLIHRGKVSLHKVE
jgi:hypothetical protein